MSRASITGMDLIRHRGVRVRLHERRRGLLSPAPPPPAAATPPPADAALLSQRRRASGSRPAGNSTCGEYMYHHDLCQSSAQGRGGIVSHPDCGQARTFGSVQVRLQPFSR